LSRDKESPEKWQQRLYKNNQRVKIYRESQSPEKRQLRLQKEAERAALSRRRESAEQRQLRLQKIAKQIASRRAHESEEQRQQRRKVETARIAAKRKHEKEEEYQKLLQRVGCTVASEHQERLVPWYGGSTGWIEKYLFYDKNESRRDRKYFVLKRICRCCKGLETEMEKEDKIRCAKASAAREERRQKYLKREAKALALREQNNL